MGTITLKVTQFADDSTCFLQNQESLDPLLSFLHTFSKWSGLTINKTKSMILYPKFDATCPTHIQGIPIVEKAKILGIWFMANGSDANHYKWNFKPQLMKIKSVWESWAHRNILIKGKVTIVNSLLVSLLQYPSSSNHTPLQVYREYKRLVTTFIWNGKKSKVSYDTLVLQIDQGGLNLMDPETRVKVALLQWVRRLISMLQTPSPSSLVRKIHRDFCLTRVSLTQKTGTLPRFTKKCLASGISTMHLHLPMKRKPDGK